jgi:tetratricopeptide (TPR) repeat protein
MNRSVRVLVVIAALAMLFSAAGCSKLKARDQLNKGVQSFKNNKYEEAIDHFQQAVALDPKLLTARLYLATAYAAQVVPGATDDPKNNRNATQAITEFQKVVDTDPPLQQKVNSLKGIASLYRGMNKYVEARDVYRKIAQLDPNDAETYYSIAWVDWNEAYGKNQKLRTDLKLSPTEPIKDKKVCEALRTANLDKVEDGMQNLTKALEVRPEYADAMAYLNLLYRQKADIECGNPAARAEDLKTADEWVDKTLATKKKEAEKSGPGGIIMDQQPAK